MDKEEFLHFIVISILVLGIWYFFVVPFFGLGPRRKGARPAETELVERAEEPLQKPLSPPSAITLPPKEPAPATLVDVRDDLILVNDLIKTYWTNQGAALRRVELLEYKASYKTEGKRPTLTLLKDYQEGLYSDVVEMVTFREHVSTPENAKEGDASNQAEEGIPPAQERRFRSEQVSTDRIVYEIVEEAKDRLVFEGWLSDEPEGRKLKVRKTVGIAAETYHTSVTLEFFNVSRSDLTFSYSLRGAAGIERDTLRTRYIGTGTGLREKPGKYDVKTVGAAKLSKKGPRTDESANISWAGVTCHYFVAVAVPEEPDWIRSVESRMVVETDILDARGRWAEGSFPANMESKRAELAPLNASVVVHSISFTLAPGESLAHSYRFVTAPKKDSVLSPYKVGLDGLIRYGLFPGISRLMLKGLKVSHSIIPNYGVAIVLLTVLVRVILHPLTRKQQVSMVKMQKLQPKINELKKKYGDDKKQLGAAQMALFREYGASPLSGCLPILFQMPVFFALFGTLRAAIELRQAGFVWVDDLTRPDTLFTFPFFLPLLGNGFNLLPILMAGAMFANQKLMQKPDAAQAEAQKMMKWMPLMLVLLFYQMPSGLTLYITASTLFGMFEQWHMKRKLAGLSVEPVPKSAAAKGPQRTPAKPSFFDKIQEMVDRQLKDSQRASSRKNRKKS